MWSLYTAGEAQGATLKAHGIFLGANEIFRSNAWVVNFHFRTVILYLEVVFNKPQYVGTRASQKSQLSEEQTYLKYTESAL